MQLISCYEIGIHHNIRATVIRYSAFFLWKTSSPAPTFHGALYDWYLATNGGFWGVRAGLAGGRPVKLILNLRDWTVHVVNAMTMDISPSSVEYSAFSLEGVLLASGEFSTPAQIDGNTVSHLGDSLPWVGERNMSIPTVVLYRLDLSYVQHDDRGITSSVKNCYYLTDPSTRGGGKAHSRFASLGDMRKDNLRVDLDVRCTMSHGIECAIQNGHADLVAVMIKLSLLQLGKDRDSRILPTLFSDNYLSLLPGEITHLHLSAEEDNIMPDCSTIIVNVDGWNIREKSVQVSCDSVVLADRFIEQNVTQFGLGSLA